VTEHFDEQRVLAMKKAIAATEGGADTLRDLLKKDRHDAGMAGDMVAQLQCAELLRLVDFAAAQTVAHVSAEGQKPATSVLATTAQRASSQTTHPHPGADQGGEG
jgi:hypothetical protein